MTKATKTFKKSQKVIAKRNIPTALKTVKNKKIDKKQCKSKVKSKIVLIVERIAKINKKGVSQFISIDPKDLRKKGCKVNEVGLFKTNNGVPYLRKDAPLSRRYMIERKYHRTNGSLLGFKLIGFNNNLYFSRSIPQEIRKAILAKYHYKCIWCGSGDRLEIDHKNGRYNNVSNNVNDFQLLCKSCNDKKRERCKKCQATGQRYNVQQTISNVLYKKAFTCGTCKYNDKIGCKGCFLYDIEDFYVKHDKSTSRGNSKNTNKETSAKQGHNVVVDVVVKAKGRVVYKHKVSA